MTTKRTNEPKPMAITLRKECAFRLAAMFLVKNQYGLKEIYTILNNAIYEPQFSKAAIRGVLTRWQKKRLLLTDGYHYILNPNGGRDILIAALGPDDETVRKQESLVQLTSDPNVRTELVILEMTKKWWDSVFDLPKAWEEKGKVYCRIHEHIAKKMWALCERKPKGKKDRTSKATHKQKSFTLVAFPNGRFHVMTKTDPRWLDDLGMWLANGGMGQSDLLLVSQAIHAVYGESIGTLEVPILKKLTATDEYRLDIEQGRLKARLEVVHSHYPGEGELEVTGTKMFRDEWLASLSGSAIAIMAKMEDLDTVRADLKALEEKFEIFAGRMEKEEREEMREQMKEMREKLKGLDEFIQQANVGNTETPDYIM